MRLIHLKAALKVRVFFKLGRFVHSCVCPEIVHISAFWPLALLVTEWPAGKRRLDKVFSSDESS